MKKKTYFKNPFLEMIKTGLSSRLQKQVFQYISKSLTLNFYVPKNIIVIAWIHLFTPRPNKAVNARNYSSGGGGNLEIVKLSINFSIWLIQILKSAGEEKQKQLYVLNSLESEYMEEIFLLGSFNFSP